MNQNIKARKDKCLELVEKIEDAMELLLSFRASERDYNNTLHLDIAERNLDDAITFINTHYDEYLD